VVAGYRGLPSRHDEAEPVIHAAMGEMSAMRSSHLHKYTVLNLDRTRPSKAE
jgi:hypothetical protein